MSGDADQSSKFKWAIENGDLENVKQIISDNENSDLVNTTFSMGQTPLHLASDYGQCDVAEYLINKGAKVNVTDKHGITPLLAAIFESHTECVKLLLEKGANRDGKTASGKTYLQCAETDDIKALLS